MEDLSFYSSLFIVTTAAAIYFLYRAAGRSRTVLYILSAWIVFQSFLALKGFYLNSLTTPPRALLLFLPPVLTILTFFLTKNGRAKIDRLDPGLLTLLHILRLPVELVLYGLFLNKQVPELMTFAGGNFDILSGITAPLVYYFYFIRKRMSDRLLLIWNFICLLLLLNIVIRAVLSLPTRFQRLAFDQPNIAVLHFPYVWLPACIVPIVLFSHLAMIRKLSR